MTIVCETCQQPIDIPTLAEVGIVECECGEKIVLHEEALTYVDEMPDEEYLGG